MSAVHSPEKAFGADGFSFTAKFGWILDIALNSIVENWGSGLDLQAFHLPVHARRALCEKGIPCDHRVLQVFITLVVEYCNKIVPRLQEILKNPALNVTEDLSWRLLDSNSLVFL